MTRTPPRPNLLGDLAVGAFALLSVIGGWLIIHVGGLSRTPKHLPTHTTIVEGAPAMFVAGLQFIAAAIAMAHLLRRWFALPVAIALGFLIACVPPAIVLASR
jgi:hypothetical protein